VELTTIQRWIEAGAPSVAGSSPKQGPASEKREEVTQQQIVPLMLAHCTVCHGASRREADLDLRTKAGMLKGGKSGPVLVPGDANRGLLLKRVRAREMPPLLKKLNVSVKAMTADEIAKLKEWIVQGAPEKPWQPDVMGTETDSLVTDEDRRFWAFQAPVAV